MTRIDAREGGNRGNYYMRCACAGDHMTIRRKSLPTANIHVALIKIHIVNERSNVNGEVKSKVHRHFRVLNRILYSRCCGSYRRNTNMQGKGCVYYATWKDDICERPGLQYTNSIWRPYLNVAETLRSNCPVILVVSRPDGSDLTSKHLD